MNEILKIKPNSRNNRDDLIKEYLTRWGLKDVESVNNGVVKRSNGHRYTLGLRDFDGGPSLVKIAAKSEPINFHEI